MHPVRQNISGHSEVCGDIGVPPAVYDPVLQQPAVVRGQVPEEGAKSVNSYGSHWGDLGGQDDTPGQAGFPGVLFFPSGPLPAPEIPGNTSKPQGAPRKYHDWASSRAGTRSREDGDSLDVFPGRGGDYRRMVGGRDMDLQPHTIFGSTKIVIRW